MGKMIIFRNLIIFAVCLLLWPVSTAFAVNTPDDPVARVVALRGQLTALDKAGNTRKLALKSPVFLNDTLKTGKRGRGQILFIDNSIVSLGRSTVFRIVDYNWQPNKNEGRMTSEINEGIFRFMGGLISRHAPTKVISKTPSSTIGIRGSMYTAKVNKQGTEVIFEGGKGIDLSNGSGKTAITRAGYFTRITDWNSLPAQPQRLDSQAVSSLMQGMDVGTAAELQTFRGSGRTKMSKMVGFSPAEQHALYGRNVTVRVQEQPARAAEIFQHAVTSGRLEVKSALLSALLGMKNVDRHSFDNLIREAVSLGLSSEEANDIAGQIKEEGLCN
jgi:hypothetical protein